MANIVINSELKGKQFTWRSEWVHEFESPWGIIERFKYANNVTSGEVLKILGTKKTQEQPFQKASRDLINFRGLDPEKTMSILGVSFEKQIALFMKRFISPLNRSEYISLENSTVFCKECLEVGYHSLFHQFALLQKCPYHLTPLVYGCPHCGLSIPYEINTRIFNYPFTCKCGANLFKEENNIPFFHKWELTNNLSIQMTEIRRWIECNDKRLEQFKRFYIIPGKLSLKEQFTPQAIISLLLQDLIVKSDKINPEFSFSSCKVLITEPELPPTKVIIDLMTDAYKNLPLIEQRKINAIVINDYFDFDTFRYICLLQTYKAIARNLKRTVLYKHIRCIRSYNKDPVNNCAYAVAYIRWRQEMESLDDPCRVERRGTIVRLPISKIPQHFVNNKMLNCISYTSLESLFGCGAEIVKPQKLWPTAIWLYGKLFAHFALARFYEWLDFAKSQDSLTSITSTLAIPNLINKLPLAVLERGNDSGSNTLRLFLWNKHKSFEN